jgi:hypothetical protein
LTKICTKDLETELKDLTFEACNLNVDNLIIKIDDLVKRIEAEKQTLFDKDEYMNKIFDVLATYQQEDLVFELRIQRSAYNNGKTSSVEAVEALRTCYKNAVAAKTWGNIDVTKNNITLLTTRIAAQAKEIARLKTSSGGGTNQQHHDKDDTDRSWSLIYDGTTKEDLHGNEYVWCKLCGPGRGKGKPQGMYMKSPHDHTEWLAKKNAKKEDYVASKTTKKKPQQESNKRKDTDTGKAEMASTDNKKLKLKIAESLVEGLTTHMSISEHDARTFVKNQLAEFNAD